MEIKRNVEEISKEYEVDAFGINSKGTFTIACIPDLREQVDTRLLKKKKAIIADILKQIAPSLREEITKVTELSLMRKDISQLKQLRKSSKIEQPKLKSRVGCLFLENEQTSIQI